MTKKFRPCWFNNDKPTCLDYCLSLKETDKIFYLQKTIIIPCNNYLPNFFDKLISIYQVKEVYEKLHK